MNYLTLDFETYWSQDHSLSKMNPIIYSTHPETELISLSYKLNNEQTYTIWGEDAILAWAKTMPWDDLAVIAHNGNGFDHMLLVWRLDAHPKLFCDTLAMARPFHAKDVGGSLKALVKHYGLGVKDATALHQTKGKHLADFTTQEKADMGVYNRMDVDQTWGLFKKLAPLTPPGELKLIDMTARMLVYPQFYVDQQLLTRGLKAERARKHAMLMEFAQHLEIVGLTDEDIAAQAQTLLMSAQKFGEILTSRGVPVPMKISPTTGRETPALAKTDEAFTALQDHDDPLVSMAARARLGVRSTILESRIEALLAVSSAVDGWMPIPLLYYGADTTGRFSGNMGLNMQNLPRVDPKQAKLSDVLRLSLMAPPDHKVVVADLSGIELRMNHFLWQVPSSMALFRADPAKADLYKEFAAKLYGVPKDEVTKAQRQIGKLAHLGLQYGSGPETFRKVAKTMGGVDLDDNQAAKIVTAWRDAYSEIVEAWATCQNAVADMIRPADNPLPLDPWGLCGTVKHGIRLPQGLMIRYPNLRQEWDEKANRQNWVYGEGRHKAKLYGSKMVENLIQALSRIALTDIMLAYSKTPLGKRCPIAHCVHDEIVCVVHQDDAQEVLDTLQALMRTPPEWFPELVTWSEGDIAQRYGNAKQ